MESLRRYRKSGLDHFVKYLRELPAPPPKLIFRELGALGYRGQEAARRAVALMAYRHVRRIKRIHLDGAPRAELPPKTNYLLMGPTGCGKTHLVELLFSRILGLPTVIVDVTTYSETGYVGQDPNTILTRLLHAAEGNPHLAAIGIICLDEFDKLASGQNNAVFAGAGTTKDVTGMGVQRELLKMLEASELVVPLELTHATYGDHLVLSTADIAFLACGAFSGFQMVARRRGAYDRIGFGRARAGRPASAPDAIAVTLSPEEVENVANFQAYGFLPELIARFTRVIPFAALDDATLREILDANVIRQIAREFEEEGFRLVVEDEVLDLIVRECRRRETGARGLTSLLTRHLEDAAFEAFADAPGGEVRVLAKDGEIAVEVIA